ncbi:LacI family transcriptional regulator [Pseudoxanthomonas broegbernensis]|uniref:LacI family transcriptional regulator n=1 Tax=Pseudoxanthomonas broegbernensis TaxID=83619 RepID=A0A7V8K7T8_9GAMM|nr:LacI family DNA-binding transcriptional regulator [Pseudoxanthomonas broegbernensis]KAF1686899.1 LacI family transcriptional regulator [Pseudoxanthomonas broegbernensis]MBB6065507.1 LacI family transcriptional regulator [Pseudoxanthomonas broegbernensis]
MPKRESQKPGAVTILDVAKHAGVSPMTASRVINGNPRVGQDLRERVQASVQTLRYRPNLAGRSLRTTGSARIGVLYSNPSAAYLNELMLGILEQSSLSGAQVLVEKCGGIASQRAATQRLLEAGVDGIILPPPLCDSPQTLRELDERGIPVVAVAGAPVAGVSSVRIDDYQGSRAMTLYLLELGHTRIGFIQGDPSHTSAQLRRQAFLDTLAESGLRMPEEYMVVGMFTYRSGLTAARQLLDLERRPTAIFCSNDDMAAAAMAVAHGAGVRIPDALTVVGFDDTPVATTLWPELTTIRQPVTALGKNAVALMLEEIRARRSGRRREATHQVMKHTLIKRQSSAAAS